MNIGDKIKIIRKSKGLTQMELFLKSGVSHITISGLETNRVQDPYISTVANLARGLGVPIQQLTDDVDFEFDPVQK